MVEFAQRMLTNRPTVALTSDTPIWLVARSPTRARDPRTEITRPKAVTAVEPAWSGLAPMCVAMADYRRKSLEKRLSPQSSGFVKSSASDWALPDCAGRSSAVSAGKSVFWRRFGHAGAIPVVTTCLPAHQGEGSVVSSLSFRRRSAAPESLLPRTPFMTDAVGGSASAPCDKPSGSYKVTTDCVMWPFH